MARPRDGPQATNEQYLARRHLLAEAQHLPDIERQVAELYLAHGKTPRQIAALLELDPSVVSDYCHRVKKTLISRLKGAHLA